MAHHKSAIKRIRRNGRANTRNSQYLASVRTAVKRFRAAVAGAKDGTAPADASKIQPLLNAAQSLLHKAATKGIIHKNNASRKVGRLTALLRTVGKEPVAVAAKAPAKKAPAKKTAPAAKKPSATAKNAPKKKSK